MKIFLLCRVKVFLGKVLVKFYWRVFHNTLGIPLSMADRWVVYWKNPAGSHCKHPNRGLLVFL